jgi:hypothetical protein
MSRDNVTFRTLKAVNNLRGEWIDLSNAFQVATLLSDQSLDRDLLLALLICGIVPSSEKFWQQLQSEIELLEREVAE